MTDLASSSGAATAGHDPFPGFRAAVAGQFRRVTEGEAPHLFTTDVGPLFPRYLAALPAERRQHYTCSACRSFERVSRSPVLRALMMGVSDEGDAPDAGELEPGSLMPWAGISSTILQSW